MRRLLVILPVVLLQATLLSGQTGTPAPWVYMLDKSSTFQRGCFDPCTCPILDKTTLGGTFKLTFSHSDPLYQYYDVTDVSLKTTIAGVPARITGSGTYRMGGEVAVEQELDLDLVVEDEPVAHFTSGRVVGPSHFPRIDLTVSINGVYCYDTVLAISSAPVPKAGAQPSDVWWQSFLPPAGAPYDVVMGDLAGLRGAGGLGGSVRECLANDTTATSMPFTATPPPGDGFWFLVRDASASGTQSYDDGDEGQAILRDGPIDASPDSCP